MITLYFARRTRALRVAWLLEELGVPYRRIDVEFRPTSDRFFVQDTPTGKLPTLVDGDATICESGAILEYILERYGDGRLAPATGQPGRPEFLQWMHYAEATAFPPMGILAWLTLYRNDGSEHSGLIEDARQRAIVALRFVEERLGENSFLLGDTFSAADIMMGFTLAAAMNFGLLGDELPRLRDYFFRLTARPAFHKVATF